MDFVLRDFTLIDGLGGPPLQRAAVYVENGRIAWVGRAAELPREAQQLPATSLAGRWVIPGLIDAHVHVCWNGRDDIRNLLSRNRDDLLLDAVQTLRRILTSGTTTVRDVGGQDYMEMALRRAVDAGLIQGPRMRTAGKVLAITGGHASFIAREADGPEEFRKAAREQVKAGADTVKLMATGGVSSPGQDIHASQMSYEEIAAATEAAHALGRTVAAHCHGRGGIRNCVLAGVDSIEHATFLDEETVALMVERGAAAVFTLGVANPQVAALPPHVREEAERFLRVVGPVRARVAESVALARQAGVLIGSGSDAGGNALTPHDFSMARELEELVRLGCSPMEAIAIATRNNARILRWEHDLGTLEAGKLADMVVLAADPTADIANVRRVEAVYQGGRLAVSESQTVSG